MPIKGTKLRQSRRRPQGGSKKRKTVRARRRASNRTQGRRMKGGDYTNVTNTQVNGLELASDAIVSMPGYPPMRLSAFRRLKEDLDRNGDHLYD